MGESITALHEAKREETGELFIDITLTCANEESVWDVDWVPNGAKAEQACIMKDANGETMPLLSWKNSNPPRLTESETYEFTDLQIVYGKDADSYKLVVRSATEAIAGASIQTNTQSTSTSNSTQYICLNCQTSLSEANLNTGPEAPEVGWEYLECPDCGHRQHPDAQASS